MKTQLLLLCACVLVLAGVGWAVYEYSSGKAEEATQEQEKLAQADDQELPAAEDKQSESIIAVTKLIVEKIKHSENQKGKNPLGLRIEINYQTSDRGTSLALPALQFKVEYPDEYATLLGKKESSGNGLYLQAGKRVKGTDVLYEDIIIDTNAREADIDRLLLSKKRFKITIWVDGELSDEQVVHNTPVDRGGLIARVEYENESEIMQSYTKLFYQAMPKAELIGKISADLDGNKKEELLVIYRDTASNTSSNICVMREGQASGINLVPGSNRFVFAEGASSLRILEDPIRASIKLKNKQTDDIVYYELTINSNADPDQDAIQIQKIVE